MAESDEWATVETVVEEEIDRNSDGVSYAQGPAGIDSGILEKSRWQVNLFKVWCNVKILSWFYFIFSHIHSHKCQPMAPSFYCDWHLLPHAEVSLIFSEQQLKLVYVVS